ncbi:DUF3718 domain-containing protein [Thalassotalea mangrovi]|uniref:DUF3718 domain-containing protein n=1 Tax=Thalassotalea mangrovi TaxID=2572245 RepID=A0A4U1B5F7_9GAMM|nr:DUF3718 domain-containing protein [Thalassotalea mangrovi]TKB45667.1 DUF3718 domain-containing protein [Thalassotalea mangrovi]
MKTLKVIATTGLIASLTAFSVNAQGAYSSYMETALIDTCRAALTDSTFKLRKTLDEYNLKAKTVALGLVCNGEDVITFAANRGATNTADYMNEKLDGASITDLAANDRVIYEVTFEDAPE